MIFADFWFRFGIEAASDNGEEKFVEWSLEGAKAAGNTGIGQEHRLIDSQAPDLKNASISCSLCLAKETPVILILKLIYI